jgi:hypothetical protein
LSHVLLRHWLGIGRSHLDLLGDAICLGHCGAGAWDACMAVIRRACVTQQLVHAPLAMRLAMHGALLVSCQVAVPSWYLTGEVLLHQMSLRGMVHSNTSVVACRLQVIAMIRAFFTQLVQRRHSVRNRARQHVHVHLTAWRSMHMLGTNLDLGCPAGRACCIASELGTRWRRSMRTRTAKQRPLQTSRRHRRCGSCHQCSIEICRTSDCRRA